MKGHKDTIRERLLHEYQLGHSAAEARQNIRAAVADEVFQRLTVFRWSKRFRKGNVGTEDKRRTGRPIALDRRAVAGKESALVPDVHLPRQIAAFSGRSAFNTFTHAVAATFNEDLSDSTSNFDQYADAPLDRNDGMYLPLLTTCTVGGDYDLSKIQEVAGHLDLPILGVNELFDFDGRIMLKGGGNGILNSAMEFPLTLSDPNERAPYTFKYLDFMADRHMQYSHVVPNVNLFTVGKDKIISRLTQNTLNPTMVG
ncbi:unnamed protein product [Heligmosomoides polygyrus]|uniref:HTH_48 domain-containing protein n=1 Tax=Heligmosomoides polygyrus TaxID=6339 RepID=A0A183GHM5_HELPZ|nr:unnamed protein product [Heligmosomoides polygyrus]